MSAPAPHGHPVGILILDTRFPRLKGDIGNPASFDFPVIYEKLAGVTPQMAVRDGPAAPALLDSLAAAAQRLIGRGAGLITTSCGFLAIFQRELAARCAVPVATSSLLLIPRLAAALPEGKRVGVLTADAASLSAAHFLSSDAPPDTPVEGMTPGGAFAATFLDNGETLDRAAVEAEAVAAARRLCARHADLGAIVLECTNLPPYRAAIAQASGVPVYGIGDLLALLR